MRSTIPDSLRNLKISCLSNGIHVHPEAREHLTEGEARPLTFQEYATTGGVTLELPHGIWVNAPVDDWFCDPDAELLLDDAGEPVVHFQGAEYPARVLPLPGYLGEEDDEGRVVSEAVFSHADRARLSPITGCTHACKFCDLAGMEFQTRDPDFLVDCLRTAQEDPNFEIDHVLVSGGTPSEIHHDYFDGVVEAVTSAADIPVDVMMTPRQDLTFVDDFVDWGVHGFSFNIELYGEEAAKKIVPKKRALGLDTYADAIERAVDRTGGEPGRVRSLIIAGLEPKEKTLDGVEFLARHGADPTLSPFRPAPGTDLAEHPPPSEELLRDVYRRSLDIVDDYDVVLGPRCIPCQHNTLTFPDDKQAHYRSAEVHAA